MHIAYTQEFTYEQKKKENLRQRSLRRRSWNRAKNAYDWIQCLASALIVCVVIFIFVARVIDVKGHVHVPDAQ